MNDFHSILGHCGSERLEKTDKIHNLKLHGEFKNCEQCAIAGIVCQILLFWVGSANISNAPSSSVDIFNKWNINNQCSTSCVRHEHVMVFLIVFSVLVCPG
jgi:hypothetical protein